MLKFVVVLYRRPDWEPQRFADYLRGPHADLALRLPGLRRYLQNHVADDPERRHPGWDPIVELTWDDREAMEAAWQSEAGREATEDLAAFADLSRTTWSIVEVDERL